MQTARGRWHAWFPRARASACGRVNVEDLRAAPARRIADTLPPEAQADACATCLKLARNGRNGAALPPGGAGAWLGYVRAHLRRVHATAGEADLRAVAEAMAEVGPPDDPAARDAFAQVRTLLLTPVVTRTRDKAGRARRVAVIHGLHAALALLPPRSGRLAAVVAAMRCWRAITKRADPGHFKPAQVLDVMLQVPDAEAYVRHLAGRGFEALGVVFHPNVLARAKVDPALRGMFGTGGAYWARTKDQLVIVKE
jgi:hypothetical protein